MSIKSIDQLHYYLGSDFTRRNRPHLHVMLCFSKISPDDLENIASSVGRTASVERVGDDLYQVKMMLETRGVEGWLITKGEIWRFYIDSLVSPSEAGDVAEKWLKPLFPLLVFARVESEQLLDVLDSLIETNGVNLGLQDYLLKTFPEGFTSKNWVQGQPYRRNELERKIYHERKLLHAIHFTISSNSSSFEARVSRLGHLVYYGGSEEGFTHFYRILIDLMINAAISHRDRLKGREKKVIGDTIELSPIVYQIRRSLTPKEDFSRIKTAVSTKNGYYMSLLSSGNPWLYLHIIDRGDGSTYDLYGFEHKIEVIPLDKASPESLAKLGSLIEEVVPECKFMVE